MIDNAPAPKSDLKWSRYSYPESLYKHGTLLAILLFLGYSLHFLNVDLGLLIGALGRFVGVVSDRYYPPDIEYVLDWGYLAAILDTLQMSFLGGFAGVCLAIPLAWFSAWNVTPHRLMFPVGRLGVISCRAIHET